MAFDNLGKVLKTPKYLIVGLIAAALIAWLYIGPLTNQANYYAFGWIFAIAFPLLFGAVLASQVYNYYERKSCPVYATGSGAIGGILGLITVACAGCPLIFLSWFGLAIGATGGIFGGPWIKALSLVIMVIALYWSTK